MINKKATRSVKIKDYKPQTSISNLGKCSTAKYASVTECLSDFKRQNACVVAKKEEETWLLLTIIHRSESKYSPHFTDAEVNNCFKI